MSSLDALIIGGGFYGCAIAAFLAREKGWSRILLVEREPSLLARASYHNQARVHNGYHYPRSFVTAHRSRINFPGFVSDWAPAIQSDFTKLYAIARRNSKVTARQFMRFCHEIGASITPADGQHRALFDRRLVEDVFVTQEYAFDSRVLARLLTTELDALGVTVRLSTRVASVDAGDAQILVARLQDEQGRASEVEARHVFNCTYSGLNQIGGECAGTGASLKQEITEMALVKVPPVLANVGITVMDGPFFSLMPFPARGLHTLSHVRYTPHRHWLDQPGLDPYQALAGYDRDTRVEWMIRDAARYVPAIRDVSHQDSLFEVKTVLQKNEIDDGRPILFHRDTRLPGMFSVLGGKIDNIYDVLDRIRHAL